MMVLTAALALADEGGLEELSMRAVARRLGVTPMALYRHVGDKGALLDGLVEVLLAELPKSGAGAGWRGRLGDMAAGLRATARRHPSVFPLLLLRPAVTPGALRVRAVVDDALREAGLPESEVRRAERMITTFVIGFAASESGGRFSAGPAELDAEFAWAGDRLLQAVLGEAWGR